MFKIEQRTTEESDEDGVSMKGSIDTHEQADDEGYRDVEDEAASASDDEKVAEEEAVTVGFIARLQGNNLRQILDGMRVYAKRSWIA